MGSSGKHVARTMTKQLKVMLPDSSKKLRISDELARCFDAGDNGTGKTRPTALIVSPFGKVWPVEVCRDGDGAFLGRGWAEFVGAHGIDVCWFLVLRHEGRGVLTVKAFDTSFLLKGFGQTITVPGVPRTTRIETGRARRPQFIRLLQHDCMEKMPIPAEFVRRRYVSEEQLNSRMATFVTGKIWHIELEKDGANVSFAGGWSKFLEFHGVTEGEVLLIRYQGNMLFTIEVFGLNGLEKRFKKQGIIFQQTEQSDEINLLQQTEQSNETSSSQQTERKMESQKEAPSSSRKRKSMNDRSSGEDKRRTKSSGTWKNESSRNVCVYEIGPPSWARKEINTYALKMFLPLPKKFCEAIGFKEDCTITLKTSIESTKSWQVHGVAYEWVFKLGLGWKIFCRENRLKEGDVCTFNIVKTTLWHVVIDRC